MTLTFFEIILILIVIIFGIHHFYSYIFIFLLFFFSGASIIYLYAEIIKIFGILSGIKLLSIDSLIIGIINLIMLCLKAFVLEKEKEYNLIYSLCIIFCTIKIFVIYFLKEKITFSNKQKVEKAVDEF